jgi:hypothetical protein
MAVQGSRVYADVNAVVGYLRDLAFAQSSQQKMFGYKRAAAAIFALDTPLNDLVRADGAWPKIPGIGPGSTRAIREVLETGRSATVELAIEASGRSANIDRRRQLRRHFLSRAEVRRVPSDPAFAGPTIEYLGELQIHSEWSDGSPTCRTSRMPVVSVVINTQR